ncbi:MAG: thioesterase domain-containing protein [Saccharofermentans sp.]|nr:thioesterase domain-containing protein [Saccharofermentans sp.]
MKKRIQLFLLPFAGGSSLSFMRLTRFLDPSIEAITIEYSGRGTRRDENCIADYWMFVNDVVLQIKKNRNTSIPYAILGYSMGSVIEYDILRNCDFDQGPKHCFFCAEGGLIEPSKVRQISELDDNDFLGIIRSLGGIDDRLFCNKDAFDEYLDLIRNDFNILRQFKYDGGQINHDITVIYGDNDGTCVNMDDWEKVTTASVELVVVEGNHFFINQRYKEIAQMINEKIV